MKLSDIPTKFPIPFAYAADPSLIETIPTDSQIGITPGRASLNDGFVPLNFQPTGAGGVPPLGKDFNGLLKLITLWNQWQNAGASVPFDATFAAAIGGYPKWAMVASAELGNYWVSIADDNSTDPDAGGAGWISLATAVSKRNLLIANDAVSPNTKRNVTATSLVLEDASHNVVKVNAVSVTINSAVAGAGGLDTGALAPSTVYYEWVIAQAGGLNPTGLMSLSSTAPTMPATYTMKVRVGGGAITDGSSLFYRIRQVNEQAEYIITAGTNTAAMPQLVSGVIGTRGDTTNTWAAISLTTKVPSTALQVRLMLTNAFGSTTNTGSGDVAPNNSYSGRAGASPPPLTNGFQGGQSIAQLSNMSLESTNIYCASVGATFGLFLKGWTDTF